VKVRTSAAAIFGAAHANLMAYTVALGTIAYLIVVLDKPDKAVS
jgi:hypothetical protein